MIRTCSKKLIYYIFNTNCFTTSIMQTINKNDLIPLLKKSDLVDQFEDEVIILDKYVFKNFKKRIVYDVVIEDDNDFNLVMDQLRYFMIKELPHEVYDYVAKNKPDLSNFKDFFFEELTLLKDTEKDKLMNESAKKGYLNLMKYIHEIWCNWDKETCSGAAYFGNLDCLRYAHENGCSWDLYTCDYAAGSGNLDCLKYAHENGCSWTSYTCSYAAENGHLDCLKYAHENGCSWTSNTCSNAARNGHLDCLKYAHENGCNWNKYTCYFAALYGYLDCLKYAIENGCPFNKQNCINNTKKHKHIVEYLEST